MVWGTTNNRGEIKVPYTEEQIRNVFKRHDKNGDCQLSKDELRAAFDELGSKWPPARAWFAQRYADDDGDGFISIEKELSKLVKYALEQNYKGRGNEGGDLSLLLVPREVEFEP